MTTSRTLLRNCGEAERYVGLGTFGSPKIVVAFLPFGVKFEQFFTENLRLSARNDVRYVVNRG